MKIKGRVIDIHERDIYFADITFDNGLISSIERVESGPDVYILPGLIDAHVHVESSMITPGEFARIAVSHGTVGVVSDPHEIANVLGMEGVDFMINDSNRVPVHFWFGAPSCVPATSFETSGGVLGASEIEKLLKRDDIKYLSEMMNYPGVIYNDRDVIEKIGISKRYNKPVDGHAPGLSGDDLRKYVAAGISTDHECSTSTEALEKIELGMKILIREGSAARNLDALKDLIRTHPGMVMLCSDDIHPEMLEKRHINKLVSRLIRDGYDLFDVIRCCTENPVKHYGLEAGLLRRGDPADFIVVDDPAEMKVVETWINGVKVYSKGEVLFEYVKGKSINIFNSGRIKEADIRVKREKGKMRIIRAFDGELLTKEIVESTGIGEFVNQDMARDILKIVVKDRYRDLQPAAGFINGFGLKRGAFASSVAHDSHNIICVGADDSSIAKCINEIVSLKGGLAVWTGEKIYSLQLNIGGIMSDRPCREVASAYESLTLRVKDLGCALSSPFMTLSFMALLVIPELKLSDRGLFDGKKFSFTSLFTE